MASLTDEIADIDFADIISSLQEGGWFEFVFPFMLVYAIVLTILNNVDLFKDKKPVRVIIALVFALFSIAFPITGNFQDCGLNRGTGSYGDCETLGGLLMSLFPGITAFSMGVLALYVVVAMLGIDLMDFFGDKSNNEYLKWILGALGLFVVIYYYARGFGWEGFDGSDNWLWGDDGLLSDPMLYILVIGGFIFWWISGEDNPNSDKKKKVSTTVEEEK